MRSNLGQIYGTSSTKQNELRYHKEGMRSKRTTKILSKLAKFDRIIHIERQEHKF